jgi:hypothetical protein
MLVPMSGLRFRGTLSRDLRVVVEDWVGLGIEGRRKWSYIAYNLDGTVSGSPVWFVVFLFISIVFASGSRLISFQCFRSHESGLL